jgi:hypothetical protein
MTMVISEFGGPKPDDNPSGVGHRPDVDSHTTANNLLKDVADSNIPLTVQAQHLREVLQKSPAQFAQEVTPFLDNVMNTPNVPPLWKTEATQLKNTLDVSRLNDPATRMSVDYFLRQFAEPGVWH